MTVSGIRSSIATALSSVTALKGVYTDMPESINAEPCAIIKPASGKYHESFAGEHSHKFDVLLMALVSRGFAAAQDIIDGMMVEGSGVSTSAVDAIEAATPSTNFAAIKVEGYRAYGGMVWQDTAHYFGVILEVSIWT